eukprot:CAMPEP_0118631872 /NCGR_PEP_ID=MMETSP0785-20121206/137_1 /TAXON_ID=91992 /ORGANISM="Bolidomonas pacifica, Strain CCMP 1866" /LENGTH=254 /DNA_ID=CAMNT_0006522593 /DNA_START=549 /DNA_END=1310 /DNA_ORIENTATION=+
MEKQIGQERFQELVDHAYGRKKSSDLLASMLENAGADLDGEMMLENAHGEVEVVKIRELMKKMKKQENWADKIKQNKDGSLVSHDSGTLTIDELKESEEHGSLKQFMALGRLGHYTLKSVGYANGNLTNIKSSPRFEAPSEKEMRTSPVSIPNLIIISVSNMESYELEFDFDPKYKLGVGLVAGWRLNKKTLEREKDLILPTPDLEPVIFGYLVKDLEDFSVKFGSLLMFVGIISWMSGKYLEKKSIAEKSKAE